MSNPHPTVRHILPEDPVNPRADVAWFDRQNEFEQSEIRHLVGCKRRLGVAEDGVYSKRPEYTYPHILPATALRHAFHAPLADEILAYLDKNGIQQHSELLNLKSSQAACLNFLYPLRKDSRLATAVLRPFHPGLRAVTGVEFEYTAQNELEGDRGCTEWLGEPPGGRRGQNRTSIDAAIFWQHEDGRRCATLIEWKYTERSFGTCGAFDKADAATKTSCLGGQFAARCLLTTGDPRRSRRYWEHLSSAGIDISLARGVDGCPFRGPFYQLMRQYLVARYMVEKGLVEHSEMAVVHFRRNTALQDVPVHLRSLSSNSVLEAWNSLLAGVPAIRSIDAERLVEAYDAAAGVDPAWRDFIRQRYRL